MDDNSNGTGDSIVDRALRYSRYGLRVFPVHATDKRPMPGYGWVELASTQTNHVYEDFERAILEWGEDNVSVAWALGLDGYLAVDIDVDEAKWPEFMGGLMPQAMINVTKRGQHLIFKMPGFDCGNGLSRFPEQGWGEVRGKGGYVVIAGPDRPGFDLAQLDHAHPFPFPEWLTEYGGKTDVATQAEVRQFIKDHTTASRPNKLVSLTEAIKKYDRSRDGTAKGRHDFLIWLTTCAAEDALAGYYAAEPAFKLCKDWWKQVVPQERWGREFNGVVTWAVGKAWANAGITTPAPTEATDSDEPPVLSGDHNTLIQFRELPDPFVLPPIEWHAKGLLMSGTHGELGGPEKSMKSYLALSTVTAIALGVPVLGHFDVPERQRVLVLSGEGGEVGMLRRAERIVSAYGADVNDLRPWLRYTTMTAPLTSKLMIDSIAAAIDELDPAIVWLDPWYAYAPGSAVASSALLTDIGQVLSNWRQAVGVGRTAMINHHLNTGGTGDGLQRLAGAGHAEWCDSWMLVDHREKPNVEEGRFRLKLRVGSRQWGGGDYAIDLSLGRFDPEHGVHIGSIRWKVSRLSEAIAETDDERHQTSMTEAQLAIKRYLRKQQRPVGRNELIEGVGGKKERMRTALNILIERGEVIERAFKVVGTGGRPKIMCSLTEES